MRQQLRIDQAANVMNVAVRFEDVIPRHTVCISCAFTKAGCDICELSCVVVLSQWQRDSGSGRLLSRYESEVLGPSGRARAYYAFLV